MHECAGELNQALIKGVIRTAALGEPEFFQDIVGFKIESAIEALEVTQIVGVDVASLKLFNQFRDGAAFFAHDSWGIENVGEYSGKINRRDANPRDVQGKTR